MAVVDRIYHHGPRTQVAHSCGWLVVREGVEAGARKEWKGDTATVSAPNPFCVFVVKRLRLEVCGR